MSAIKSNQAIIGVASEIVEQAAHGFVVGQFLAHDGTTWFAADPTNPLRRARGLVVQVLNANEFVLATDGIVDNETPHGLPVGQVYYLAASGLWSPAATGIRQRLFRVISNTQIQLDINRNPGGFQFGTEAVFARDGTDGPNQDNDSLHLVEFNSTLVNVSGFTLNGDGSFTLTDANFAGIYRFNANGTIQTGGGGTTSEWNFWLTVNTVAVAGTQRYANIRASNRVSWAFRGYSVIALNDVVRVQRQRTNGAGGGQIPANGAIVEIERALE